MDRAELYDQMATRKSAPKDFGTYIGDNGRVNRCIQLMRQGKIIHGGTLIDVGGSIGDLCYAAKKELLFGRVFCVDISQKNLEAAASKIGLENTVHLDTDREGLRAFADGEASVVTALDFIEHIIDPEKFARECFRVLRRGGEVFVNTPNIQYWQHIEQLVQGRFPHTSGDREVYHGGHLAFFTYLDLCDIFGAVGFTDFVQIKDEEGYRQPPQTFNATFMPAPKTQNEYIEWCMRFGNPNLLFKASIPYL